ncbi:hypothetical protein MNEG_16320, partial [Monoraphidium neglectum]
PRARSPPAGAGGADEVGRQLHHQKLLLDGLVEKAARCARLVEAGAARLQEVRARLASDLKGKAEALTIDEAVLGVHGGSAGSGPRAAAPPPAEPTAAAAAAAKGAGMLAGTLTAAPPALVGTSPGGRRRWEGDTAALVAAAHQLVGESARLRQRVKEVLLETASAAVGSADAVNTSLARRIQDTRRVKAQLQERLKQVEQEAVRAAKEQESLRRSLEEKRAPLEQLKARFDMRRRRPGPEAVADEVESALAAEAAGLAAVARQLERHEAAVGEQVRQLRDVAAALRPGIDDRAAAEEVEALAARLDGREDLDSPRAPSIIS